MAGPYPQYPESTPGQPGYSEQYPSQPFPAEPAPPGQPYPPSGQPYPPSGQPYPPSGQPYPPPGQGYQPAAASVYPGMLPPPVSYPTHRRWLLVGGVALIVAIIAAATVAVIYGVRNESSAAGGELSSASVKVAIQDYLDALAKGDTDTVARNTLCGMYDAVRDRRSDQALAKLSSDAFRKQFSQAQVTTIDKVVLWSPNQAQVLFTMRIVPSGRSSRSQGDEVQAIAQLLSQNNRILVCSYLLRAASQY